MSDDIKLQPGTVFPDEYDWKSQFGSLDTINPFTKMDTGKVIGLAVAYQRLIEQRKTEVEAVMAAIDELEKSMPSYMDREPLDMVRVEIFRIMGNGSE